MKFVTEFTRSASGYAEARDKGQTFYFPVELAGSTVSVEITASRPAPGHFAAGYLVRGRNGYAELTANGQTFYFPLSHVGQFAAVDVISPVTQTTTTGPSPVSNFIAQARAARSAASTGAGAPTPDQRVNATTGRIRVHVDDDLEVLG